MNTSADAIADCVLSNFDQLPEKRKPRPRNDGAREWVPLSGIVLVKDDELICASLGTGMKCLPHSKLPLANGSILHDWHAEVLATRAFNRFLIDECIHLCTSSHIPSRFIRRRNPSEINEAEFQPFTIREDVRIHMYCSEAPCGDASMELCMDSQEDATPWTSPPPSLPISSPRSVTDNLDSIQALRGRSHFGLLGAVRLKPSRPDAPPTLSKSCTDKVALSQSTSLLSSLSSLLISPRNAYLSSLVLPKSQYVDVSIKRAFSKEGRISHLTSTSTQWTNKGAGYTFTPFNINTIEREFTHSRRSIKRGEKAIPSNLSAVYTPHFQETLIGGVLQGRKQFDPRGASRICRRSIWKAVGEVAAMVAVPALVDAVRGTTYKDVKETEMLNARRAVKHDVKQLALKGWVKNEGDDEFTLEEG